jgi:hypothetical protein
MRHKRYTPEQIIGKLRQAEVRSAEGATVAEFVREPGITEQTAPSGARRNSVSVSDSARCYRLLQASVKRPNTRTNQRPSAPSAYAIGMGCFAGNARSGSRLRLDGRRSGVRSRASPTDVTATNPGAPTEVRSGSVRSCGRAAYCDCANRDRNSDRTLLLSLWWPMPLPDAPCLLRETQVRSPA